MIGNRRAEEVVDSNMDVRPSTRALKRALLTALRCLDPDAEKRPKMSQVVRMLESEEYPILREVNPCQINFALVMLWTDRVTKHPSPNPTFVGLHISCYTLKKQRI